MSKQTAVRTGNEAAAAIDGFLAALSDWRGTTLAQVRALICAADPRVVEAIKWRKPSNPEGVPCWSHAGLICTGEPAATRSS